jgi:hypothetical protein
VSHRIILVGYEILSKTQSHRIVPSNDVQLNGIQSQMIKLWYMIAFSLWDWIGLVESHNHRSLFSSVLVLLA